MLSRRELILNGSVTAFCMAASGLGASAKPTAYFVTGFCDRSPEKTRYGLAIFNQKGVIISERDVPERLHGLTISPHIAYPHICAPARRPGRHLYIFQQHNGALYTRLTLPPGYHFQGHAAYHLEKPLLYTSENHYQEGLGVIGIWDVRQHYHRLGTIPSGGIGPHEIRVHPNKSVLVIANGGLLTHPHSGHYALNLEDMSPNLTLLSLDTYQILRQYHLPQALHQNSIRHFDINAKGQILIGLQYQGGRLDDVPLIALCSPSSDDRSQLIPLLAPLSIQKRMRHYCGSVSFLANQSMACISHPKGNISSFWHVSQQRFLNHVKAIDVCGLAATQTGVIMTTGIGRVVTLKNISQTIVTDLVLNTKPDLKRCWDNHLTAFHN